MATVPSLDSVIESVTRDYITAARTRSPVPTREQLRDGLLAVTRATLSDMNTQLAKDLKYKIPYSLYPVQIAWLVAAFEPVCYVVCTDSTVDSEYDLLGIYRDAGPNEGCYETSDLAAQELVRAYSRTISSRQIRDVCDILKTIVPHRRRTQDRDLVAVNNGIFNFKTKQLLPFSPDYIFLAKSKVDYVHAPANPVIHNPSDGTDWDVESWMAELSDDPEVVQLLWEVLGGIIRPFVQWNKSVWFYSTKGNNGKGTLCALMRNICGPGTSASVSLADFSKDFMLEPLTRATAIIVDENDVGAFVDRAANLKAVVTGDVMQINRKFKQPVAYQFHGLMVQCLNEMPRIKDKSDSFYRRQIFVPFSKCFTGAERKYIKNDYLARPEVLQYVLWRVLNMTYYELSEPAACADALAEYKEFNDPVRQFCEDVLPRATWDLLPFGFLYELYVAWFKRNSPSGSVQGRNTFINDIVNLLPNYPDWMCPNRLTAWRSASRMAVPEPMILEYKLDAWKSRTYSGTNPDAICTPDPGALSKTYKGIVRTSATMPAPGAAP